MPRFMQDACGRMVVDHGFGWVGLGAIRTRATPGAFQVSSELMEVAQQPTQFNAPAGSAERCVADGGKVITVSGRKAIVNDAGGSRATIAGTEWCVNSYCKFCDNCEPIHISQVCL